MFISCLDESSDEGTQNQLKEASVSRFNYFDISLQSNTA